MADDKRVPDSIAYAEHGEHEELGMAHDKVVTAAADKQRYEAQKNEPEHYPGDSGKQAKFTAKLAAEQAPGGLAKELAREAEEQTGNPAAADDDETVAPDAPKQGQQADANKGRQAGGNK